MFDEPLSSLDINLRQEMRKEIVSLYNQLNSTFIYVTHDQQEALSMGTMLIVMNQGKIQQIGTAKEIFFRPKNKFVAQFIGEHRMNIIEADICNNVLEYHSKRYSIEVEGKNERKIQIGLRPSNILLTKQYTECSDKSFVIEGIITNVAFLGHYFLYTVREKNMNYDISICTFNETMIFSMGDRVQLLINFEKLYFFDAKTGNSIKLRLKGSCTK